MLVYNKAYFPKCQTSKNLLTSIDYNKKNKKTHANFYTDSYLISKQCCRGRFINSRDKIILITIHALDILNCKGDKCNCDLLKVNSTISSNVARLYRKFDVWHFSHIWQRNCLGDYTITAIKLEVRNCFGNFSISNVRNLHRPLKSVQYCGDI